MPRKKNQRNKTYECIFCHGIYFWIYAECIITFLDKRKKDYMICPRLECKQKLEEILDGNKTKK